MTNTTNYNKSIIGTPRKHYEDIPDLTDEIIARCNEPDEPVKGNTPKVNTKKGSNLVERTGENKNYEPFEFKNTNIVSSDYIQIPETGKVISKFELQGYNNLNWEGMHFKLQENGLCMPVPYLFTKHFMNVLNSYKSKGKSPLFDASGNSISEKETRDMALHLLKDHIATYKDSGGTIKGAWTYLDAYFKDENGIMKMLSEYKVKIDSNGKEILIPDKVENLESCLTENCFADLIFNSQGLLTKKHLNQNYIQGENIYYWAPVNGGVARFGADSGRAFLNCNWDPSDTSSSLGVFGIAQVFDPKLAGGIK